MEETKKRQLKALICNYAKMRKNAVERRLESPHFAALLVDKYATGVIDAAMAVETFDARDLTDLADREVAKIDPEYRQKTRHRYQAYADIALKAALTPTVKEQAL